MDSLRSPCWLSAAASRVGTLRCCRGADEVIERHGGAGCDEEQGTVVAVADSLIMAEDAGARGIGAEAVVRDGGPVPEDGSLARSCLERVAVAPDLVAGTGRLSQRGQDRHILRILFVIESAGGGSGRHLIDLSTALLAAGHEVHLIFSPTRIEAGFARALAAVPRLQAASVPMSQFLGLEDLGAIAKICRYIAQKGPFDVVHAHSSKAGLMVRLLPRWLFPSVRVYTPHAFRTLSPDLPRLKYLLYGGIEWLLGRYCCDRIIAVSPDEMAHALRLKIPHGRLRLIVNGIGAPPRVDRGELRDRLGLRSGELCVGFVGRLTYQKAPERLLAALCQLKDRRPEIVAVIVGDGDRRSKIEAMIREQGLADRIRFLSSWQGWELMAAFDIFVMPSRYEAMPYVLLEALSMGLPVVTTRVCGASLTVKDGENGLVVPNVDEPEALAAAIERLAADPALRYAMAQASRCRVAQFQLATMVRKTLGVYTSCKTARLASA